MEVITDIKEAYKIINDENYVFLYSYESPSLSIIRKDSTANIYINKTSIIAVSIETIKEAMIFYENCKDN